MVVGRLESRLRSPGLGELNLPDFSVEKFPVLARYFDIDSVLFRVDWLMSHSNKFFYLTKSSVTFLVSMHHSGRWRKREWLLISS